VCKIWDIRKTMEWEMEINTILVHPNSSDIVFVPPSILSLDEGA